jgi:hypothetical protein
MISEEATHTNFIVFGLTRPGLEPAIYITGSEHANHYTNDAALDKVRGIQFPPAFM